MGTKWASGQDAIAECDVCGFRYKLRRLRKDVIKGTVTEIKACPQCWDPDQPQLHLGEFPVYDPQAIPDPRPDSAGYPQSRSQVVMAGTFTATGFVGQVNIVISPSADLFLLQDSSYILLEGGGKIALESS